MTISGIKGLMLQEHLEKLKHAFILIQIDYFNSQYIYSTYSK